jgi:hypothetical protein
MTIAERRRAEQAAAAAKESGSDAKSDENKRVEA